MTRAVLISNRHPRLKVPRGEVARAIDILDAHAAKFLGGCPAGELSLVFLTDPALAKIHADFMDDPTATDVITFALGRPGPRTPLVGDIYIAPEVVRGQARRHGVPAREELARVVVHGVLHALGHDHPAGDARSASPMWTRQEKYLALARRQGVL